MYTQVGSCPHCGAPIYSPAFWMGVCPPPVTHTCQCVPHPQTEVSTGTSEYPSKLEQSLSDNDKEIYNECLKKTNNLIEIKQKFEEFIDRIEEIEPEIAQMINDHFWELIGKE